MSAHSLNSAHDIDLSPQLPGEQTSPAGRPGLSRPLIELIDMPSPEQFRTIARILGLVNVVEQRLQRESAERKTAGETAA